MEAHQGPHGTRWLLAITLVLVACGGTEGPAAPAADLGHGRPPPGPALPFDRTKLPPSAAADPLLAAWTAAGALALVDGRTGHVLDENGSTPAGPLGGQKDIAWDPHQQRLLLYEGDPDDQAGEIWTIDVAGLETGRPHLGDRQHRAWVDGRARLWPSPQGIVVFHEGYGDQWRLLRDDGVPTASVAAASPASVFSELTPQGQRIFALGYGPPGSRPVLRLTEGHVSAERITAICTDAIGVVPTTVPPSTRMVPWPDPPDGSGDSKIVVVDLAAGRLMLHLAGPETPSQQLPVPLRGPFGHVEQTLALPRSGPDARRRIAILLSDPSTLVVLTVSEASKVAQIGELPLPGEVRRNDRFFGRDALALSSDRLLVATSAGIRAVTLRIDDDGVALGFDGEFDGPLLRGPLAEADPSGAGSARPLPSTDQQKESVRSVHGRVGH